MWHRIWIHSCTRLVIDKTTWSVSSWNISSQASLKIHHHYFQRFSNISLLTKDSSFPQILQKLHRLVIFFTPSTIFFPLTADHSRQNLFWYREWHNWEAEWRNVMFIDEPQFCLDMHIGRRRVRRRPVVQFEIRFAFEKQFTGLFESP